MVLICKSLRFRLCLSRKFTKTVLFSPDDTQVCSCYNVTKGDVVGAIKSGECKNLADVKSRTKAGTGCGGCLPLVQSIINRTLKDLGREVSNHCKSPSQMRKQYVQG